ncbi:DUF4862 family protein [Microbacterium sp. GXF7504]
MPSAIPHPASPSLTVSGYVASPAHAAWDPAFDAALLPALAALPDVAGLELPWLGGVHPHDDAWFLAHVPAGRMTVTALPFTMQRAAVERGYGLASPDAAGRAAALADARRLAADVRTLQTASAADVEVVVVHSAPRGGGDADAFAASLAELAGLDWSGAELVVEHCDAEVPGQPFEKGFLPVEAELAAIERTGAPIGMWLNWGRSAVELRDVDAVTAQIAAVAASGRLRGLALSGAAAVDGPYGRAWADAHVPLLDADPVSGSLLDAAALDAVIRAAGAVPWIGVKVVRRPSDRTPDDVAVTIAANLALVRAAVAAAE